MTTPSLWSGRLSFSRDGSRLAYASLDWRSTLVKVPFDPVADHLVGPPQAVLKTTQPIRDHQLSPDGQWVAFVQTGGQEDLFVSRVDGRDFRRLTDDAFRDRGPSWAPDGKSIAFYSDRSGAYQLWTIRPDGSGLEQLTRFTGSMNFPVWSPDGKQIATKQIGGGWHLVDMASNAFPRPTRQMPEAGTAGAFWPLAWSPDGRTLAGTIARPDGTIEGVAIFSLASGGFERFDARPGRAWCVPVWLADSRRLLIRDRQGIYLQDLVTKRQQALVSVGGYATGLSLGVSRDNRWITYTETATEGDIWVAELK
jgi:Tol biopolymer transport system component